MDRHETFQRVSHNTSMLCVAGYKKSISPIRKKGISHLQNFKQLQQRTVGSTDLVAPQGNKDSVNYVATIK